MPNEGVLLIRTVRGKVEAGGAVVIVENADSGPPAEVGRVVELVNERQMRGRRAQSVIFREGRVHALPAADWSVPIVPDGFRPGRVGSHDIEPAAEGRGTWIVRETDAVCPAASRVGLVAKRKGRVGAEPHFRRQLHCHPGPAAYLEDGVGAVVEELF